MIRIVFLEGQSIRNVTPGSSYGAAVGIAIKEAGSGYTLHAHHLVPDFCTQRVRREIFIRDDKEKKHHCRNNCIREQAPPVLSELLAMAKLSPFENWPSQN